MNETVVLEHKSLHPCIPACVSHSPVPRCPCVPTLPCPCVPFPLSLYLCLTLCPQAFVPTICPPVPPCTMPLHPCVPHPVSHHLPPCVPAPLCPCSSCVPAPVPKHLWVSPRDSSVLCPFAQQCLCVPWAAVLAVSCCGCSGDRVVPGGKMWILPAPSSLGCSHCWPHREPAIPTHFIHGFPDTHPCQQDLSRLG